MFVDNLVSDRTISIRLETWNKYELIYLVKKALIYTYDIQIFRFLKVPVTNSNEETYFKKMFSSSSSHIKIPRLGWNEISGKINSETQNFS